jgi:hypothetical protein
MLIQGRSVFPGETVIEKIVAHQNAEIPDLVQGDDERFGRLNQVFRRMLAKKPEERFPTIEAASEQRCPTARRSNRARS